MSDGCREEHRTTCAGCPKMRSCERVTFDEEVLAALKLKEFYPEIYRKKFPKHKNKRKSAARVKVKRNS